MRDSQSDDDSIPGRRGGRYEADYEYDGRGQLVRERIMRYDVVTGRMVTTQDTHTTYDLGKNATHSMRWPVSTHTGINSMIKADDVSRYAGP